MQLLFIMLMSIIFWQPITFAIELTLEDQLGKFSDNIRALTEELKPLPPDVISAEYAKQLFAEVAAERAQKIYTQSNAHLSIPRIQEKVAQSNLLTHKQIQQEAFAREKELGKGAYVFYTAVPSQYHVLQDVTIASYLRLMADVTKKLYKIKADARDLEDFHFLRYTYKDPLYDQYENVTDFMIKETTKKGLIDDNDNNLKPILLSTNIAYFGNAGLTGESTQYYFDHPQPWATAPEEFLKKCLESFHHDPVWAAELLEAAKLIKMDYADLFQIFIPTNRVDEIAYLSWRQGLPFDIPIIKKLFNRPNMTFGRGDKLYHEEILEKYSDFTKKWQAGNREAVTVVDTLLSNIKKGDYTFWKNHFMTNYKENPAKYIYLNYYEARLLVTNKYILNPTSGIKIYRYTSINPEQKKLYKEKLNEILTKMSGAQKSAIMLDASMATPAPVE